MEKEPRRLATELVQTRRLASASYPGLRLPQ